MPKSSSLAMSVGRDHHVGRLDIAVHDMAIVRVLNGVENREAQRDAVGGREPMLVARSDRCGAPATYSITKYGRPSGVVPPSKSAAIFGWFERGEDLAFMAEPADHQHRSPCRAGSS